MVVAEPVTDELADWWQHTVTVARYAAPGANGETYDAPVELVGFVDTGDGIHRAGNRLVMDQRGEAIVSSATLFLPAATAEVPAQSKVTLPAQFGGRETVVIASARRAGRDVPEHLELALL